MKKIQMFILVFAMLFLSTFSHVTAKANSLTEDIQYIENTLAIDIITESIKELYDGNDEIVALYYELEEKGYIIIVAVLMVL